MGLFDDDFYSTKVPRRKRKELEKSKVLTSRKWTVHRSRRTMATWQVSVISSAVSAVVAVLLFSLVTGQFAAEREAYVPEVGQKVTASSGDPYDRIIQAAALVRPAVVSIINHKEDNKELNILDESALGSGVIYKKDDTKAFIITNNHVIEGSGKLEVVTVDGVTHKAVLVGADKVTDIAVLSMDAKDVTTVAQIGDSSKLRLGETVIAIGNPLGLGDTLTSGIVSYTERTIPVSLNQDGVYDWEQEVIQTDAAINEGNSGGALVDLDGKVIGINTMKISDTGVEGLGFAIPANHVVKTADELAAKGKISRSYLGVYSVDLNNPYVPLAEDQVKELNLPASVKEGVVVLDAVGPAEEAGLQFNDVITKFDDQPITSTLSLRKYLYEQTKIGDELKITYYRNGEVKQATVKLLEKPQE
ncbi:MULTISPECIES: trypsin-like peptidase domain-containing protein [unclassified Paenibacillus]|uniref:S1C family serine protease n=1 Tax=unclassified Paenibacillus TaxID=185978 RepID=UPI0024055EB3|nr:MULTISPECIES: trypsin-like peptidase domain-containing protein [unclassified Paenibacillus]MDF9839735.1 serine protease Do [Paenibacillus sp. PastF-2]MDF9846315.1 serine protease Do [Paenibacillus sp. PastM-2]MDF9853335.1 serine protease Do [Paenibacillus sp. PastF-1]MDH6478161.1 serine protease Do [Paenibacillus sp. PastH-2]MDH6506340.1 serine protease Do [Paenibacillus sp. PastM-3]